MADAIATLGLAVDASGAIKALGETSAALDKTTTAADKTVAAAKRASDATGAVGVATRLTSNDLANAARRYDEMIAAMKGETAAAKQVETQAQATATATREQAAATEAAAVATTVTDKELNRLRSSLTGLLTPILGTVGSGNQLVSTLSQLTLGAGTTVGVLAAVAAIGVAYDVLSEKSKKLREDTDKAIKALSDLARTQRQGVGGELAEQIAASVARIKELQASLAALQTTQRLGIGAAVGGGGGGISAASAVDEKTLAKVKEITDAIAQARLALTKTLQDANRQDSSDRTAQLADLAKGNALTVAEMASARTRLANLKQQIDDSLKIGGDPAERARLVSDFKKLNDALNVAPDRAAAKEAAKDERDKLAALKEEAVVLNTQNQIIAEGNRLRNAAEAKVGTDAVAKIDAQIAALKAAGKAEADRYLKVNETVESLRFQVSLIGKTREEVEKLTDAEVYRKAIAEGATVAQANEIVVLQRQLRETTEASKDFGASMQNIVSVTQQLGTAFGNVGKSLQIAVGLAAQLQQYSKASDAAAAAQGTKGAASANAAQGAAAAGVVGTFIAIGLAGFQALQNSAKKFREEAAATEAAINNFNQGIRPFLIDFLDSVGARTFDPLAKDLGALEDKFAEFRKEAKALGLDIATINAIEAVARQKIIDQQAKVEKAALDDLKVRELRAKGLTAEADAMAQSIADATELADVIAKFGDGAVAAALRVVQAAEAIARAAKKAEDERRSIFDNTNGALAFTDPRAAGDAAFAEAQQRRYNDAVARGASAAELASIEFYNLAEAMDRARQIAEQDRRTQESLTTRVLGTLGNDRATQDFATAAQQRQEIADAIRDGMSPSNLALLRFTQFAERSQIQMQRAIEDGTKAIQAAAKEQTDAIDRQISQTEAIARMEIAAIDEQIKSTQLAAKATAAAFDAQITAIRENTKAQTDAIDAQIEAARGALDAANAQVNALDKQVQTNQKVIDALTQFSNSVKLGDLSILSPEQKLAEARAQFEALATAAQGGDANAATNLPNAANALLQASRAFNGSNGGFVADFQRVQSIVAALTQQFGATLPIDQQQLEAARQTVTGLQQTIDALGKQKDAIQNAANKQIDVLQKAKDQANEDAQKVIDRLNENKQKISDDTAATVAKLQETKQAIQDAAQAQIDQLIKVETEAHLARLKQDQYWQTFLGLTDSAVPLGNGTRPVNIRDRGLAVSPAPVASVPIPTQQLNELKTMRAELKAALDEVKATTQQLTSVVAAGASDEVAATNRVTNAIGALANETRFTNQAQTLRAR